MTGGVRGWATLVLFIFVCFAAAGVGSLATSTTVGSWYPTLRKPAWNPPARVFGPVWSVLYLCMAVAGWLVWKTDAPGVSRALWWFFIQLGLNVLWSVIFFGARSPGPAFAEIVVLWGAILATTVAFWRTSALAGFLLVPYLLWVTFAAALNYAIWQLNRV